MHGLSLLFAFVSVLLAALLLRALAVPRCSSKAYFLCSSYCLYKAVANFGAKILYQ